MGEKMNYSIFINGKEMSFADKNDLSKKLESEIIGNENKSGSIKNYEKDIILEGFSQMLAEHPDKKIFNYAGLKLTPKGDGIDLSGAYGLIHEVEAVLSIYETEGGKMRESLKKFGDYCSKKMAQAIEVFQDKYDIESGVKIESLDKACLENVLRNMAKNPKINETGITFDAIKKAIKKEFNSRFNILSTDENMMFQNLGLLVTMLKDSVDKDSEQNIIGNIELIKRINPLRESLNDLYEQMPWLREEKRKFSLGK